MPAELLCTVGIFRFKGSIRREIVLEALHLCINSDKIIAINTREESEG